VIRSPDEKSRQHLSPTPLELCLPVARSMRDLRGISYRLTIPERRLLKPCLGERTFRHKSGKQHDCTCAREDVRCAA
jgi:hypothetical protein